MADVDFVMAPSGGLPAAAAGKPRGSLADAVRLRRECVPCRGAAAGGRSLLPALDADAYVTTARLAADTAALAAALPPDIDLVVAVPRSGLLPGALAAVARHVPLVTVSRQAGVIDPGNGGRLDRRPGPRHVLLLDDTAANGTEMRAAAPVVARSFPGARVTRAVVYCSPQALGAVDLCVREYPGQHYLEWNWANAGHGAGCCYDFDGVLCRDFTAAECATAEGYRAAMGALTPLHLPRRRPIPLIVTCRPESTRGITLDWLDRWGVTVARLVMLPDDDWPGPCGPAAEAAAAFKARHYAASAEPLFAESNPAQAGMIADLSGKPVLCPAAERVFRRRGT